MKTRFLLCALIFVGSLDARASTQSRETLCDILGRIRPGERIPVTLSGVYAVSYEHQVFYDPSTPSCVIDVQPVTWVEFSSAFPENHQLLEYLRRDGRVLVTFSGVLWGPGEVKADDLTAPPMIAYANRIANRRYGHMNAYRTQFVIDDVQQVRRVPKELLSYGAWAAQRTKHVTPRLLDGEIPRYPQAASSVGIAGPVVIEVSVARGTVKSTRVVAGDRMLVDAVLTAVSSWRFEPEVTSTFTTTFVFELRQAATGANPNDEIELRLPSFVRINAPLNGW